MMDFVVSIVTITIIYSIIALALNIRYGYAGLPDFGIAGFVLVGAYVTAIFTAPDQALDVTGAQSLVGRFNWPILTGILAAVIISAVLSAFVALLTLRIRDDYFAVITIGIAEIFRWVAINEHYISRGPQGIKDIPFMLANYSPGFYRYIYPIILLVVLTLLYFICRRIYVSGFGRALRGIREEEDVVRSLGRNPFLFKFKGYVLGGAIAGLGGSLWAHFIGSIQPHDFTPELTFILWASIIIGGKGNNAGVILGTVLVIGLFEQATRFLPSISNHPQALPAIRMICIGLLLLLTLRFKPRGLLPEKTILLGDDNKLSFEKHAEHIGNKRAV